MNVIQLQLDIYSNKINFTTSRMILATKAYNAVGRYIRTYRLLLLFALYSQVDSFKLWIMWKARGLSGFQKLVDNALDCAK